MKRSQLLIAGLVALIGVSQSNAAVVPLLTDGTDLSFWTASGTDVGPGADLGGGLGTYGIENVAGPAAVGTGDVARIWDYSTTEKPELQADMAPLTTPFKVEFQTLNVGTAFPIGTDTKAIRFRMANAGDSITSESRSAFSVSWQTDGKLTAKFEGGGGSVNTISTDPLVGAQDITLIINPGATVFGYDIFNNWRDLDPYSYDVYINGVLFNDGSDADDDGSGLEFTLTKSAATFDPLDGLGRIGLVGSSNGDIGPNYHFDNIILTTGFVPEPASCVLLIGSSLLLAASRRR